MLLLDLRLTEHWFELPRCAPQVVARVFAKVRDARKYGEYCSCARTESGQSRPSRKGVGVGNSITSHDHQPSAGLGNAITLATQSIKVEACKRHDVSSQAGDEQGKRCDLGADERFVGRLHSD